MSTNFFDEDELKNLPPIERAKLIQKKKAELERKLEEEASSLEEASKVELINQQKELDVIIESESLQRKSAEEEDLKRQQSMLEQTINNSPESESKHESVEYGLKSSLDNKYVSNPAISPDDSQNYRTAPSDSVVKFKEDQFGAKLYSDKPENDYL